MKTIGRTVLWMGAVLAFAALLNGAPLGGIDVVVKKSGKAVCHARTDAAGSFATPTLEPGSYSVEFRSDKGPDLKGRQVSISVAAGKGTPRQAGSPGEHLRGGVAVNIDVAAAAKLSGQVTLGGASVSQADAPAPKGMEKVRANVKIINGKRYVWVPAPIGSNMGGKWVEEGTAEARLSTSNKKGEDAEVLRQIQDQGANIGSRP